MTMSDKKIDYLFAKFRFDNKNKEKLPDAMEAAVSDEELYAIAEEAESYEEEKLPDAMEGAVSDEELYAIAEEAESYEEEKLDNAKKVESKAFQKENPEKAIKAYDGIHKGQHKTDQIYEFCKKICKKMDFLYIDDPACGGILHRFNGRFWEPLKDRQICQMIYEELPEERRKVLTDCDSFCKRVLSFIKYECAEKYNKGSRFTEKNFDAIKNHVVFKDCIYDVQNDQQLPFNKDLPYIFGLSVRYFESDKRTKAWDKLLYDATDGDYESVHMMKACIGYLAVPNLSAKSMVVLAYAKDSGKTTLGRVCANMYEGMRANVIDLEKLSGRFAYENASTTILYYDLELNTDKLKVSEVAELKKLTGERMIRSEGKFQSAITIPIRFKIMLATNTGLYLDSNMHQDDAFYRRIVVLPFIVSHNKNEIMDDMYERLMEELPAFLSKCVRELRNSIKSDGGIVLPESELSRQIKDSWRGTVSIVDEFMESSLIVTGAQEDKIAKVDIYSAYRKCADEKVLSGMGCQIVDKDACIREILSRAKGRVKVGKARGLVTDSKNPVPCLTGLKWVEEK